MRLSVCWEDGYHKCFLYNQEDVPVAYLSCIPENNVLELCDIEVREGYRGRGYARRVIAAVQEHFGAPLTHTGSYTPLGLERVAKYFHTPAELQRIRATYRPMGFVDDWERTI
jgi:GNAT superfamily N-acetyltransferase